MRRSRFVELLAIILAALLLAAAIRPSTSIAADYLSDPNVPVAVHHQRTGHYKFTRQSNSVSQWGLRFRRNYWELPDEKESQLVHFLDLPDCEKPETELRRIYHHTPGTENFDVLYFDPMNREQRKRAAGYPHRKVEYSPALIVNPRTHQPDHWQVFARFIQIRCLPTRFRFHYIGAERYIEYRRGNTAWKPD